MSILNLLRGDDTYKVEVTNKGKAGLFCRIVDLISNKTIAFDVLDNMSQLQSFIKLNIK